MGACLASRIAVLLCDAICGQIEAQPGAIARRCCGGCWTMSLPGKAGHWVPGGQSVPGEGEIPASGHDSLGVTPALPRGCLCRRSGRRAWRVRLALGTPPDSGGCCVVRLSGSFAAIQLVTRGCPRCPGLLLARRPTARRPGAGVGPRRASAAAAGCRRPAGEPRCCAPPRPPTGARRAATVGASLSSVQSRVSWFTSTMIVSPSSMRAIGPPSAASGATRGR